MNDTQDKSIISDLIELKLRVSFHNANGQDDKALQPFRQVFKEITNVLLASTPVQRENAKRIRSTIKANRTV